MGGQSQAPAALPPGEYLVPILEEPGSVVGIAIAYGLDGPGIESQWGEIFRTSPDRP